MNHGNCKQYYNAHSHCPKCHTRTGQTDYDVDISDIVAFRDINDRINQAYCPNCQWTGKVHDCIPDIDIDSVWMSNNNMTINWNASGIGFGQLVLTVSGDGKLKKHTEMMGNRFCQAVLHKLLLSAEEI